MRLPCMERGANCSIIRLPHKPKVLLVVVVVVLVVVVLLLLLTIHC